MYANLDAEVSPLKSFQYISYYQPVGKILQCYLMVSFPWASVLKYLFSEKDWL